MSLSNGPTYDIRAQCRNFLLALAMESLSVTALSLKVPSVNWAVERWRSTVPSPEQITFPAHALDAAFHLLFQ